MKIKNPTKSKENRTRVLPVCISVSQPIAPPRAPSKTGDRVRNDPGPRF
jgi:hypothetical protein